MCCEYAQICGFYEKFGERRDMIWRSLIKNHCENGQDCARRLMYEAGHVPPSDDFMPVGVHASKALLSIF